MVDMLHKCHEMAKAHPQYDFYTAVSSNVSDILDNGENGVRTAAKGQVKWSESLGVINAAIDGYLEDANS